MVSCNVHHNFDIGQLSEQIKEKYEMRRTNKMFPKCIRHSLMLPHSFNFSTMTFTMVLMHVQKKIHARFSTDKALCSLLISKTMIFKIP